MCDKLADNWQMCHKQTAGECSAGQLKRCADPNCFIVVSLLVC